MELAGEARSEIAVDLRKEVESHHGGVAKIGCEEILGPEFHAIGQAILLSARFSIPAKLFVELDAHRPRTEFLRCKDGDSTIPGTEVVDQILLTDSSNFQHLPADRPGRWGEECGSTHLS